MNNRIPTTVDEYIAAQPVQKQAMLQHLREVIKAAAPAAEEVISYRIPCYTFHGMLVGFGAHRQGCSFYVMSTTMPAEYAQKYTGLKYAHSTIHFELGKKLPVTIIKSIVKARMKQNVNRAHKKTVVIAKT